MLKVWPPPSQLVPNSQLDPPSQLVPSHSTRYFPPTSFHWIFSTKYVSPTIYHIIFSTKMFSSKIVHRWSIRKHLWLGNISFKEAWRPQCKLHTPRRAEENCARPSGRPLMWRTLRNPPTPSSVPPATQQVAPERFLPNPDFPDRYLFIIIIIINIIILRGCHPPVTQQLKS